MKRQRNSSSGIGLRRFTALVASLSLVLTLSGRSSAFAQTPTVEPNTQTDAVGPRVGKDAPDFTLTDPQGKVHKLSELRGRPVALLFLCGCTACTDLAEEWKRTQAEDSPAPSSAQKSSDTTLPKSKDKKNNGKAGAQPGPRSDASVRPVTVLVFSGDAPAATDFARRIGLDPTRTLLLADPLLAVTIEQYHVDPCPRVFVLDSSGVVRYTNNHADDAPQKAAGAVIAGRAFAVLHSRVDSHPRTSGQVSAGK